MSFLNELFQIPEAWNDRWQVRDGVVVYNPSTAERIALGEDLDESEDELPFSLSYAKQFVDEDQMSMIMRLSAGEEVNNLSRDFGSGGSSLVLDGQPKDIWAAPDAKKTAEPENTAANPAGNLASSEVTAENATAAELAATEEAIEVAEVATEEEQAETKEQAKDKAKSGHGKDDHGDDHGKGGHGHGHKKDPHEMSGVELASISGTCNAKVLNLVLKKGADGALINALGNPAMDADKVAWIVGHRAPTATVLSAIGRCRFARDPVVAAAICKNPKSPLHLARSLLGRLKAQDLKEVVKAPGLPNALKSQARHKLAKKKK